jgi:hypothetical protein
MKKIVLLIFFIGSLQIKGISQAVKPANIYPSNLEENMYFKGYDASTNTIKGFYFLVLSDGNNSKDKTPAFNVKLYLYQEGKDPIFIKTFDEPGIWHMGSKEYKGIDVDLTEFEVPPGTYRVGVFVNADKSFEEKESDNAMLFQDPITIGKSTKNNMQRPFKKDENAKSKKEDDSSSGWDTEEKSDSEKKSSDDE